MQICLRRLGRVQRNENAEGAYARGFDFFFLFSITTVFNKKIGVNVIAHNILRWFNHLRIVRRKMQFISQ